MKVFKKLLAVVLSLAMVIGSLTVTALGAVTEISDSTGLATALSTGGEYKVTKNITSLAKGALSVAKGVNVTIDLNGYKVTRNSAGTLGTIAGTLTIKDTSANASGIFGQASVTATSATTVLTVSGKLNLESGTLKIGSGKAASTKLLLNTGKINISGGTITGTTLTSEATNGHMIVNQGTINMTGGSITGNNVSAVNGCIIKNDGNFAFLYLEGGEISGNTVGTGQDVYQNNGSVWICGNMKINGVLGSADKKYIYITSGMFNAKPDSKHIVEGYEVLELTTEEKTANPGYNYKVQVIPAGPTVAKIGDTEYDDFDKAFKACLDDETILLVADCESDIRTDVNTKTTIDLNGYTLTCARTETASSARLANVNPTGVLTIVDSSTGTPGMIIAPANCTLSGAIAYAYGGKLVVKAGRFQEGASGQSVFDKGKNSEEFGGIDGILEIYGGYYTDVSKAGLDNYVKGSDASKLYGIIEDTTYPGFGWTVGEPVADVDGTKYFTFSAAIAAAVDGSTVKLLADCAKRSAVTTIESGTEVTLDLNGYALTNTYSNEDKTSTNHRYFSVAGTLNITDSSAAQTGSITGNAEYTGDAAITFEESTGQVNIDAGTYYEAPNGTAANNCFSRASGAADYNVTGGWFTEKSYQYAGEGYNKVEVTDASKASSPITVSNTTKTINYLKNGGKGTDIPSQIYAYVEGYTTLLNTTSLSYTKNGSLFVGWSTNASADPDGSEIIVGGAAVNFADEENFPGNTIDLNAIYKTVASYMVGETGYETVAELNADIADGTVAEGSTIVLTGEKPDGTIVLDGKDMTIDGSALDTIVLPDDSALVSATNKARVNVLGTMPTTDNDNTENAPIYSEAFIYLNGTLTTTGSVYQAKTVADFVSADATLTENIEFTVFAEVAPKVGDEASIYSEEGTAGMTTVDPSTGLYQSTIRNVRLAHAGNDIGLIVSVGKTIVGSKTYTTVQYLSDVAKATDATDELKTLCANLIIACKYINDVGEGDKGTAINLSAAGLEWIASAKTTTAPAKKSMTIDTSSENIRFAAAGLHVTDKLNIWVRVQPKNGLTFIAPGTHVVVYIDNGDGYEQLPVSDDMVTSATCELWHSYIYKLLPTQYDSDIKIELYTAGNVLAQTMHYSVNTYCSNTYSKSPDLCTAIYNYGTAAQAYVAAQ